MHAKDGDVAGVVGVRGSVTSASRFAAWYVARERTAVVAVVAVVAVGVVGVGVPGPGSLATCLGRARVVPGSCCLPGAPVAKPFTHQFSRRCWFQWLKHRAEVAGPDPQSCCGSSLPRCGTALLGPRSNSTDDL